MTILLYTTDLMCSSKVLPVAKSLSMALSVVGSEAVLREQVAKGETRLVIFDLNGISADLTPFVAELKQVANPPAVIAFGPHVHEAKLAAAQQAGCDAVLTRGQFHAQTEQILRKYLGESS